MRGKTIQLYSTVIIQEKHKQRKYVLVRPNEINILENKITEIGKIVVR